MSATKFAQSIASKSRPLVFGMIHVPALPGTPKATLRVPELIEHVCAETEIYARTGVDGILVENMHDVPYLIGAEHGPEVCATMTRLCAAVAHTLGAQKRAQVLLGVQILAAANRAALSTALAAEFDFVRAEAFVFGHVADEGWMDACAGDLLRYRRTIGAQNIAVLVDIKKKHCAHAVTADVSVAEVASAAQFFLADGVILTGTATGRAASAQELIEVRSQCSLPVLIGSGISAQNVDQFAEADGFIVGSHFKQGGQWSNPIDEEKVHKLMHKVNQMAHK